MNGSTRDEPITPDLLADLQAGLLDDATAARLRRRVRTEPEAAAILAELDKVRRDVAALGTDPASAPEVPPEVSARVISALRAAERGRRRPPTHWRMFAAVAGGCAAVLAIGLGVSTLLRAPEPARSTMTSLGQITVSPRATDIGLSEPEILRLLSAPPDLGPLSDTNRRTACLSALGYPPGVRVLGARPLDVAGRSGVLVLLPADTRDAVVGLVVAADCDSAHAERLAETVVHRP
ncbi:anti-sigma factor family protein [Mycolicibacterium sp. XJ870]